MARPAQPVQSVPSFEDALKKLEALVAEMESGDLPLDTMMKDFEEGRKLVAFCAQELDGIKQRIEKVTAAGGTETLEVK